MPVPIYFTQSKSRFEASSNIISPLSFSKKKVEKLPAYVVLLLSVS